MTKVFYTPEEVAAELAPAISKFTIIQKVRTGDIECSRGSKRSILFTRPQIDALIESMREPARPKPAEPAPVALVHDTPNVFGATERSHQRTQRSQGSRVASW